MNETTNDFFDAVDGEREAYYDCLDARQEIGLPYITFDQYKRNVAAPAMPPPMPEISDESCPF